MEKGKEIRSFKDLVVWQKSYELSLKIHKATRDFPKEERYGLSFELRKTSRSLPCNIAEGHKRRSTEEYIRFLNIAQASGAEL